jgi:hypothetical protein
MARAGDAVGAGLMVEVAIVHQDSGVAGRSLLSADTAPAYWLEEIIRDEGRCQSEGRQEVEAESESGCEVSKTVCTVIDVVGIHRLSLCAHNATKARHHVENCSTPNPDEDTTSTPVSFGSWSQDLNIRH